MAPEKQNVKSGVDKISWSNISNMFTRKKH